jgi:hypothetical protein
MAKSFLDIELRVSKTTANVLEKYAEYRCCIGDVIDEFAETLPRRDKGFKQHLKPPAPTKVEKKKLVPNT